MSVRIGWVRARPKGELALWLSPRRAPTLRFEGAEDRMGRMSRMDPSLADRTSSKGREPGASPREHRSNPGRSPERAGQALELVRPLACPRPMTSGSGSESGYRHRHRTAGMFDPDSDSDPGTEGILRTAFRVRGSFATGTPGGPRSSANPGLSAATPSAFGKGAGENAGSFAVDMRGGVLVLEPMGKWDRVEGGAWWFEYEYRPSG